LHFCRAIGELRCSSRASRKRRRLAGLRRPVRPRVLAWGRRDARRLQNSW